VIITSQNYSISDKHHRYFKPIIKYDKVQDPQFAVFSYLKSVNSSLCTSQANGNFHGSKHLQYLTYHLCEYLV